MEFISNEIRHDMKYLLGMEGKRIDPCIYHPPPLPPLSKTIAARIENDSVDGCDLVGLK